MIRIEFGKELKKRVVDKECAADIGLWAHEFYVERMEDIMNQDPPLREVILALGSMELGPEFELNRTRLFEIAEELMQGKQKINLNYF